LLGKYLFAKNTNSVQADLSSKMYDYPKVTVQLPIYNEKYVVARLIDNIMLLDYPKDKIQIQILDDSTDETVEISRSKVKHYQSLGFNIVCLHRSDRQGFKAGALRDGLKSAEGEFIAIFDADFLPSKDFILKTLPSFNDSKIGVVQTRWDHINQNHSLLTELQAFQLNVHFTIEQKGRYNADYLLQFNGTAGVWRKTCIEDAGGWEADTLTEDLDLSYRAQLKGWKIQYLEEVTAPAELPAEIYGLKSQQFRWMKGGAETARKLLPKVWRSDLSLSQKFQANVHLFSSSIFIFVFVLGLLSFPIVIFTQLLQINTSLFGVFLVSLLSIIIVYYIANVHVAWPKTQIWKMVVKFIFIFPIFLAVSMALSLHNMIAVIQGFCGFQSSFVRTPKYGNKVRNIDIVYKSYFSHKLNLIVLLEGLLCLYFVYAIYYEVQNDVKDFLIFHILLALGYFTVFAYAISSRFSK